MFIPAGGHLLNAVSFGRGERTFVAHGGWVGSWELWQQPIELMQDDWRCIAYDHRGSGASTAPPEEVSPEGLVDDLFTVLDHYAVDRCVLAGESMGALTVLAAALERPDRFAGLVIVDGVTATSGTANDHAQVRAGYSSYVSGFVDACVPETDSDHLRRWGRQILLRADPESAARMLESHDVPRLAPDLTRVCVPTLVIHGDRDAIVPLEVGRATAAAIPDAELVVITGAGHVPTVTRPHAVVEAISQWAARLPSAT
jgi:pimeloyl-ACP methyl ester carboxylesterase